ncbi:hypothetical protein GCM10010236_53970 [Streptomyces eurythermus]|nr:hypothetical protein GCM10010236_53970 [Streptomyces eurythermus]
MREFGEQLLREPLGPLGKVGVGHQQEAHAVSLVPRRRRRGQGLSARRGRGRDGGVGEGEGRPHPTVSVFYHPSQSATHNPEQWIP